MGFKEDLLKRIERKRAEISELEAQVKTARTYLQALEDMYKLAGRGAGASSAVPSTASGPSNTEQSGQSTPSFRPNSMLEKTYAVLKAAGRPMHVTELLPAIGRGTSRADRSALSGTLGPYIQKGDVFIRPAPNTFGLVGMSSNNGTWEDDQQPVPPPGFGKL